MNEVSGLLARLSEKAVLVRETAKELDEGLQQLQGLLAEVSQRLQVLSGPQTGSILPPGPNGKRRGRPPKSSYPTAPEVSAGAVPGDVGTTDGNDKVNE